MEQQVMAQVVMAWLVAQIIQWAKKITALPWITDKTDDVARIISVVLAFFSSLGIAFTFDKEAGTLIVTGLSVSGALAVLWAWLQQIVLQHVIYRGALKTTVKTPPTSPADNAILAAVADLKRIAKGGQ